MMDLIGMVKLLLKKNKLTEEQYFVTQKGGTEKPYTGQYCNFFRSGIYLCICCDVPLFHSKNKIKTGGGWPDFKEAIDSKLIKYIKEDNNTIEVKCNNCDSHLGHVFNDGPPPLNKRY